MRQRWLLIILGPALVFLLGSVLALLFLSHPIPKTATPAQRLYLSHCAECHGANGHGSWRATLFLIRPGDLGDARTLAGKSDDYLFELIKNGGAATAEGETMTQRARMSDVKLPGHEEPIAPVTILDEHGRVVRVVQASEFRRAATIRPGRQGGWRLERG